MGNLAVGLGMEGRPKLSLVQIFSSPSGVVLSTLGIVGACAWVFAINWNPNLHELTRARAESLAYQISQAHLSQKGAQVRSVASAQVQDWEGSLGRDAWGRPFQYVVQQSGGGLVVKVWSQTHPELVSELKMSVDSSR